MPLKKKTAHGSLWNLLRTLSINGIDFVVYALLARVLTIEDFALLIFCLLIIEFANVFPYVGVGQNLIQRKEWDREFASSTFTFMALFGLGISLLVAVIGTSAGYYLHSQQAAYVILALSIIPFLVGLQSVLSAKLEREFKQAEITLISASSTIVSGVIAILLVLNGAGLWSLVVQKVFHHMLLLTLLAIKANFTPQLLIQKEHVNELVSFCLPLLWVSILSYVNRKANNFYAAFILGANAFAIISIAKKGQEVLTQSTLFPIDKMVVPSLSRVANENKVSAFYRLLELTSYIVIPCFLGLGAVASQFIGIAFGDNFLSSANLLLISTSAIIAQILVCFLPNLLISLAQTRIALKLNVIDVLMTLIVGGISVNFGLEVMLIALVATSYLIVPFKVRIVAKYLPIKLFEMIKLIFPASAASLIMVFTIYIIDLSIERSGIHDFIELLCLVIIGVISYLLALLMFFRGKTLTKLASIKDLFKK
jgi:O-antigen/teichoic acid export membrane protein